MSLVGRIIRRLTGRPASAELSVGVGHIDVDAELPFLKEQVRAYASTVRTRATIFQDNFTGETVEMRAAYRAAMAEPSVKAALLGKIGSVMALGLQVKPAANAPLDHEVVDFLRHALQKCQGGLPDLIWSILSGGLLDGFSVCEKVWRKEERGRFAGKISLLKLKAKDTRYIQFEIDTYRNVTAVIAMRGNSGTPFSPSDFVLFKYLSLFENPFGMSDLRGAYRAAQMIPAILRLRMIFLDKYTGPFLWAKVADPALVNDMKASLAQARQGGFITTTPEDDLEVMDLATRGTSEFLAALDDMRKEIAIGISGAFLHMMTGGLADQRGNSQVQQDTVDLFIWLLKTLVEACINEQLVPDLVVPNYGNLVDFPTVTLEAPNPEMIVNELQIDESLASIGVPLSLSELYERTGRRPPKDPADQVQTPAPRTDFFANAPGLANPAKPSTPGSDKPPATFAEGQWITIGGKRGEDGKRAGGSAVFIKDGKIVKGHPSLHGKKLGDLKGEADSGTNRQQLHASKEYEKAAWRKRARQAGHDPKHLDELAGELRAHHDAFASERKELLQEARQHSKNNGYGDLQRRGKDGFVGGREDDQKGFDQTTEHVVARFPHHFRPETGEHGSHEDQLREMLAGGNPELMSHGDAYEQAFDTLMQYAPRKQPQNDYPADWDDPIPA